MKYSCNNVFMIRNPSLPIETYLKLEEQDELINSVYDYAVSNNLMDFAKEALQISSPSLYSSLGSLGKDRKKDRSTYISLVKYMIRASTRPTPYGVLASVALGSFYDINNSDFYFDNQWKHDVKVDTYWICKVIHDLENSNDVITKLNLKWNKICYISGNRLKNPYFTNHGCHFAADKPVKKANIRFTPLIKLIKDESQKFISFQTLKSKILNKYTDVPEGIIINTLKLLIDNEFLITDLRLPTYCENNLKHVINVLGRIGERKDVLDKLIIINNQINNYKSSKSLCNNHEMLGSIYYEMSQVYNTKNYLEVNLARKFKCANLSNKIKDKLEYFINSLVEINIEENLYTKLKKFKNRFIEKYGYNVEVPFFEIIDENGFNGLSYLEDGFIDKTEREIEIRKIIDNKIQKCLFNGEEIAHLVKEDFNNVIKSKIKNNMISSFDMNFFITKTRDKKLHFTLGPNYGSSKAGNTFQRFSNIFDQSLFKVYINMYEQEKNNNNCLLVEARELETNGRSNNITNYCKNYDYHISIGTTDDNSTGEIFLDDLAIGIADNNKLYIKIISKDKICKIISDNMLNSSANSKLLVLLKEISNEYENSKVIERLTMLHSNEYVVTPRINFEGITICPRKWLLTNDQFSTDNFEEFISTFEELKLSYKIHNRVYWCENDNRLLLNLEKKDCLEILFQGIKTKKIIELCELEEGLLDDGITMDISNNHYISEMIFSFILNDDEPKYNQFSNLYSIQLQDENRIFTPFENGWVYIKLYGVGDRENHVIKMLPLLLNKLNNPKFFFLRYIDEVGKHLRIRFKFSDEKEALNKFLIISKWLRELRKDAYICEWTFNQYEREINRYGGIDLIENIETLFWMDSKYVIELLNLFNMSNDSEKDMAYFIGLSSLAIGLTKDNTEIFNILDKHWNNKKYRKEFNKDRKKYIGYLEKIYSNKITEIFPAFSTIDESMNNRKIACLNVSDMLHNANLSNRSNIILSLMHMLCNRLSGDIMSEDFFHSLLRNALYSLLEKGKHNE